MDLLQVDAFADGPGSGNPAGVCLLAAEQLAGMTDTLRQRVAERVNLSETAFIEPVSEARPQKALGVWRQARPRWFPPRCTMQDAQRTAQDCCQLSVPKSGEQCSPSPTTGSPAATTVQVDPSTAGTDPFGTASLFRLRWFTPSVEVPLCGHATLASAAVIFNGVGQ